MLPKDPSRYEELVLEVRVQLISEQGVEENYDSEAVGAVQAV